jgi:multidrug resistance efflux pump
VKHSIFNSRGRIQALILFVVLLVLGMGLYLYLNHSRPISSQNAYVYAEAIPLYNLVGGQISKIHVKNLSYVKKGDVLFEFDNQKENGTLLALEAKYEAAKVALEKIKAQNPKAFENLAHVQKNEKCKNVEAINPVTDLTDYIQDVKQQIAQQLKKTLAVKGVYLKNKELQEQNLKSNEEVEEDFTLYKSERTILDEKRECLKFLEVKQRQMAHMRANPGKEDELLKEQKQAEAKFNDIASELAEARSRFESPKMVAPQDGLIVFKDLKVSDFIKEGKRVCTIVVKDSYYITAFLSRSDLKSVNPGQAVTIKLEESSFPVLKGVVESYMMVDSYKDKYQPVRIQIKPMSQFSQLSQPLIPGMKAQVKILNQN